MMGRRRRGRRWPQIDITVIFSGFCRGYGFKKQPGQAEEFGFGVQNPAHVQSASFRHMSDCLSMFASCSASKSDPFIKQLNWRVCCARV